MEENKVLEQLAKLRSPFEDNQISKLPKPTKAQTDAVKKNFKEGVRCAVCGGWHHPKVIHLDYVGHAALTDRLLDVDPMWNWKPLAVDEKGLPLIVDGGMWLELTICGVTRLGYGDAQNKDGHNAIKEIIGDGLRNGGMRFGIALALWHKGELHHEDGNSSNVSCEKAVVEKITAEQMITWIRYYLDNNDTADSLEKWLETQRDSISLLSPSEQEQVSEYEKMVMVQMVARENKPPEPPTTITCPKGGIEVTKADCEQCPEVKKCDAHKGEEK